MKDIYGNEIMFSVKSLASLKNCTIENMAKEAGIDPSHLKMVSAGYATMTGTDLYRLSRWSGVPVDNIITEKQKTD